MNKHLVIGTLVMVLSIALAIVMMALNGWRGNCNPGESSHDGYRCWRIGMREAQMDEFGMVGSESFSFKSRTCDLRFGSRTCDHFFEAGTIIMATGIIAFVLFIAAVVLLCVAHRKVLPSYRYGALALLYITSALMILGSILYAQKAAAGYSFILMIIAGFFYFCGVGLVLGGGWKISVSKGASNPPQEVSDAH